MKTVHIFQLRTSKIALCGECLVPGFRNFRSDLVLSYHEMTEFGWRNGAVICPECKKLAISWFVGYFDKPISEGEG